MGECRFHISNHFWRPVAKASARICPLCHASGYTCSWELYPKLTILVMAWRSTPLPQVRNIFSHITQTTHCWPIGQAGFVWRRASVTPGLTLSTFVFAGWESDGKQFLHLCDPILARLFNPSPKSLVFYIFITFQKHLRKVSKRPSLESSVWRAGYMLPGSLLTGKTVGRQIVVSHYWQQWGVRMAQLLAVLQRWKSQKPPPWVCH